MFAADVLIDTNIAVLDEGLVQLGQFGLDVRRGVALGAPLGVVGRAGEQDRRVSCAPFGVTITV